ncbi:MAG: trigger factor [Rikenellaceae bacterium]
MNVVRENLENQEVLLTVTVSEADYAQAVNKALQDAKRKANIPGFRPGMVPMGMINKMYRKGAVAEEAYKVANKACFDFIEAEKIDFVGDVIPSEKQGDFDFENNTEHEFVFELGLAPEFSVDLTKKNKITSYKINVDEKMREGFRSNFLRRYGKLVDVDTVALDEALTVTLDSEAMQVADAYVGLISMSDEERAPFIGKKVGDTMDVDVNELYKTPSQRASILQVKEEELAAIDPKFKLTITQIRKFAEPEMNDEFFKMAFTDESITNQEQFNAFVEEQISSELSRESDYLLTLDVRKYLLKKADITLPEAFLKRWLHVINEGRFSMEEIERDFAAFLEMMKWNIIKKKIATAKELKLTEEIMISEAKAMAMMQFAQYGMANPAEDVLENFAQSILSNKEEAQKIQESAFEKLVVASVKADVTIATKDVDADEFTKLVEAAR